MARLARTVLDNSDDELAELDVLIRETKAKRPQAHAPEKPTPRLKASSSPRKPVVTAAPGSVTRRRKLGGLNKNPLLGRWDGSLGNQIEIDDPCETPAKAPKTPSRTKTAKSQVRRALERRYSEENEDDEGDAEFSSILSSTGPREKEASRRLTRPRRAAAKKLVLASERDEGEDDEDDDENELDLDAQLQAQIASEFSAAMTPSQTPQRNTETKDKAGNQESDSDDLSDPPPEEEAEGVPEEEFEDALPEPQSPLRRQLNRKLEQKEPDSESDNEESFGEDEEDDEEESVDDDSDFVGSGEDDDSEDSLHIPEPKPLKSILQSKSSNVASKRSAGFKSQLILSDEETLPDPGLEDAFSQLKIFDDASVPKPGANKVDKNTTPSKSSKPRLTSPKKPTVIPDTPYHASSDAFWSQGAIDDWNNTHSRRKPVTSSPNKKVATIKTPSANATKLAKEARKAFDERKHALATTFLAQLDMTVTSGELSRLAASTGGVHIRWTKNLNTTAGRANWKRETTKAASGSATEARHYASIELAEKVITTDHRLLNVVAHEFCHLANFMVSGETKNPHGKSFKEWAARVTARFGDSHGIDVTTKHDYEIDFRYVWVCQGCATEYRRHSKSIDPERHRCGACKEKLIQIKPTPRGSKAVGAGVTGKDSNKTARAGPSQWQIFMKEQMKIVRAENPGIANKEIMRLVAQKWAKRGDAVEEAGTPTGSQPSVSVGQVEAELVDLTLDA